MKSQTLALSLMLSLLITSHAAHALTADDLYARGWQVPTETLTHFLTHVEDQISLVSIHQGISVSFDGDQGEGYWQRRKDSDRVFVLIRFKDGSRSTIWIERTPSDVADALYEQSTPLRVFEDGKQKVFAEMKSLTPLKELLGSREIKVHQLTLLTPTTVYSVSH